jgi:hypothetical protein
MLVASLLLPKSFGIAGAGVLSVVCFLVAAGVLDVFSFVFLLLLLSASLSLLASLMFFPS